MDDWLDLMPPPPPQDGPGLQLSWPEVALFALCIGVLGVLTVGLL